MRASRGRCAAAPDPDCESFIEKEELIYVTTAIYSAVLTRSDWIRFCYSPQEGPWIGPNSIIHLRIDHGLAMDVLHVLKTYTEW
jgi:hypothetical protein